MHSSRRLVVGYCNTLWSDRFCNCHVGFLVHAPKIIGMDRKVDVIKCIQQPIDANTDSIVNPPKKGKRKKSKVVSPASTESTTSDNKAGDTNSDNKAGGSGDTVSPRPSDPQPIEIYALSCFGWGMSGAVALKADKLRWIPGQRSARYDIAGFASLISDWPIADKGRLEYREFDVDTGKTSDWKETDISLINMIATNLDYLGVKHPIYPGVKPDDGRIVLSYIDSKCSRRQVVKLGLGMKKGKFLGVQKGTVSLSLNEFKLTPTSFKSPFCIDGDPHDVSAVHVTCMHQALRLFYLTPDDKVSGDKSEESSHLKNDVHSHPAHGMASESDDEDGMLGEIDAEDSKQGAGSDQNQEDTTPDATTEGESAAVPSTK